MGSWTAIYALCRFNDSSVCQEQEFMAGNCSKSQCTNWTLANGCQKEGLLSKTAKIKEGGAKSISDILGWDYVVKSDSTCYSFYAAQPPAIGMTEPVEIECPLGIREIISYAIDAPQAIKIIQSMRCGDTMAEMSLSWPLVPGADEPIWHIRTTIGNYISIGANTGNVVVGCQPT